VWWTNFSAGALERSVAESLAKLKLSQLDLVLLHWPNASVSLAETIGALCKVKREELTRYIGVSNFTVPLLEEALGHAGEPIVANQFELHPYLDQSKLIEACRRRDVAITAYSPLARGRIRDDPVLGEIGRVHGKSRAQVTLRWLVQQGIVAIPRTSRIERLNENLQILDLALTEPEMLAVSRLARSGARTVDPSWAPDWD
jgi:diketogulonate reductase-like aldo/keto reductase